MTLRLRANLLGDFRLSYDEAPLRGIDTPCLQSLLAYLVLHHDAPPSCRHLASLFWPDSTEAQAPTNLCNLSHHLRHDLPEADRFLYVDGQIVQWRPDGPFACDVVDLESTVDKAQRAEQTGDRAALQAALEKAVDLYGEDLLPDCVDELGRPVLPRGQRQDRRVDRRHTRHPESHEPIGRRPPRFTAMTKPGVCRKDANHE